MKVRESSRSSLFLLELMISIVFFALAAAGCVQVFAKAHMLSQEAGRLDMAVSVAQSLAEEYSGSRTEDDRCYYDELGNVCGGRRRNISGRDRTDRGSWHESDPYYGDGCEDAGYIVYTSDSQLFSRRKRRQK